MKKLLKDIIWWLLNWYKVFWTPADILMNYLSFIERLKDWADAFAEKLGVKEVSSGYKSIGNDKKIGLAVGIISFILYVYSAIYRKQTLIVISGIVMLIWVLAFPLLLLIDIVKGFRHGSKDIVNSLKVLIAKLVKILALVIVILIKYPIPFLVGILSVSILPLVKILLLPPLFKERYKDRHFEGGFLRILKQILLSSLSAIFLFISSIFALAYILGPLFVIGTTIVEILMELLSLVFPSSLFKYLAAPFPGKVYFYTSPIFETFGGNLIMFLLIGFTIARIYQFVVKKVDGFFQKRTCL